jgi:deoxyribonuclease V
VNLEQLAKEQEELAKVVRKYDDATPSYPIVIGVDVAYSDDRAAGAATALNASTKELVASITLVRDILSDYIPGFFQLREGPILIELLKDLKTPGIVLVDGNGILHPRRFGLASYLGVTMNIPTIGVAKKLLLGTIGARTGCTADILHDGEIIGRALWLKERKPLYVSIGHRISLDSAIAVVSNSSVDGYPEPLRRAHRLSREALHASIN